MKSIKLGRGEKEIRTKINQSKLACRKCHDKKEKLDSIKQLHRAKGKMVMKGHFDI